MAPHRPRTSTDALRAAMALVRDKPQEALALIEGGLQQARREGNASSASLLARHGGAISTMEGDFGRALRFYEEALLEEPTRPLLHLALADICERLNELERAAEFFEKAEQLLLEQGDEEMASAAAHGLNRVRQALSSVPDSSDV